MRARTGWEVVPGALAVWLGCVLIEIVLVGKLDVQETPVGIAIALLAAIVAAVAVAASGVHYYLRPSWLGFAVLVVRNVVRDTFLVFGVLLRRLAGAAVNDAYQDIPFAPGGDDAESAARRALVVAGMSTSPNEIALQINSDARTLRVHVLAVTSSPRHSEAWPL